MQRHRHSQVVPSHDPSVTHAAGSDKPLRTRCAVPPTRLCLPTPQLPTFRLATGALSTSDSRIRPKPLPTDRARSLPGLWHGDSFIVTTPDTLRWRSDYMDWVTFRKQRWVTLRARQRY